MKIRFFWILGGVIFGVICIGVLISHVFDDVTNDWVSFYQPPHYIEMIESVVAGYDQGSKTWEIKVPQMVGGKHRSMFQTNVMEWGRLFDSRGRVVLNNIVAKGVKINAKSKVIIVTNNVTAAFIKRSEQSPTSSFTIQSKFMKYIGFQKKTILSDQVKVSMNDGIIDAEHMVFEHDDNQLTTDRPFNIILDDYQVNAKLLQINIDQDEIVLKKHVQVVRPATPLNPKLDLREQELKIMNTQLNCDSLTLIQKTASEKTVYLNGNIVIAQKGKSLRGSTAVFDQQRHTFMIKNAILNTDHLHWIIHPKKRNKFKSRRIQDVINQAVKVQADQLIFNTDNRSLKLLGDVKVWQDEKVIYADQIELDDQNQMIYLKGNVDIYLNDGKRIQGEVINIDILKEEIKVIRQGKALFYI